MSQVTIYLDDDSEARVKRGVKVANDWPEEVKALVGAWADFPSAEDLSCQQGEDLPRESL